LSYTEFHALRKDDRIGRTTALRRVIDPVPMSLLTSFLLNKRADSMPRSFRVPSGESDGSRRTSTTQAGDL
jgi:hypothetical protein